VLPLFSKGEMHVVLMPLHLAFEGLSEVLDEVPAVQDLLRLWRTFTQAMRVFRGPVPGRQLDGGMLLEPRNQRGGCSVTQNFDRFSSLQVNDQRAIERPSLEGEVIDANAFDGCRRLKWGHAPHDPEGGRSGSLDTPDPADPLSWTGSNLEGRVLHGEGQALGHPC
jgi:hypothetical protein